MAKYDCTKIKDFMHEIHRLENWCANASTRKCNCCTMNCTKEYSDLSCVRSIWDNMVSGFEADFKIYDFVIQKIQNWSDSHPEKRDLTEDERNILKAFKALGFNYIAADKSNCVCTYTLKPRKGERGWYNTSGDYRVAAVCKAEKFFGDILSYDDEEPAEIEKLLEGDK